MRLLPFLILLVATVSCNKKMIQLATLSPINPEVEKLNDEYVFDNDTVRITYRFWSHHGKFEFLIENKLGVPIYIDWKKSNVIFNKKARPYWDDKEYTESNWEAKTEHWDWEWWDGYGRRRFTTGESISRIQERITFLPPKSILTWNEYALEDKTYYPMDLDSEKELVSHEAKNEKLTEVYTKKFKSIESNLKRTNFLTISDKENFEHEWFINHEFYLSQIQEMELNHFRGKCRGIDSEGRPNCPRKLKSNTKYFLYVPKGYDFKKRKKRGQTEYEEPLPSF